MANKPEEFRKNIVNDIYYAFRFRDLSKEAIMILAESLIK